MENESKRRFQDLSDEEIWGLVESLNSLHEGELGISMLVACGKRAIPALRQFLLNGKPSGIFEPRQRVVRALAELGAKDILLEYLASERPIRDPVVANGEEAVMNTAARALASWQTDDVFYALLEALRRKRLTGVIETLGEFKRSDAIPGLVMALEDDFCRTFAEDALSKIGALVRPALIEAARTPDPSGTNETPSSRNRRKSALRLLGRMPLEPGHWSRLAALLYDRDAEIAARSAVVALKIGNPSEKQLAVRKLVEALPTADWLLQGEIESCLEEHFDITHTNINQEISRRLVILGTKPADNVLRLLLGIVDRHKRSEVA